MYMELSKEKIFLILKRILYEIFFFLYCIDLFLKSGEIILLFVNCEFGFCI